VCPPVIADRAILKGNPLFAHPHGLHTIFT